MARNYADQMIEDLTLVLDNDYDSYKRVLRIVAQHVGDGDDATVNTAVDLQDWVLRAVGIGSDRPSDVGRLLIQEVFAGLGDSLWFRVARYYQEALANEN